MLEITINKSSYQYSDSTIINIVEGLIGIPRLRNVVLVENPAFQPFHWLASVDDETCRFIVVEPELIFPEFDKSEYLRTAANGQTMEKDMVILALVNVSSEWRKTTLNLRAPILLNPHTKKAAQVILSDSSYKLAESLPF